MSTNPNQPPAALAADPSATSSPTVTLHQQRAESFCKSLDAITEGIPKPEFTHPAAKRSIRSLLAIPMKFIATVIGAVEQTPELQAVNKLDVTAARDALQFIEAYSPVVDKVTAFLKSLNDTIAVKRANVTSQALQVYDIGKSLARDPNASVLRSHVANMKRDLGRRRARVPVPVPPAVPSDTTWPEGGSWS